MSAQEFAKTPENESVSTKEYLFAPPRSNRDFSATSATYILAYTLHMNDNDDDDDENDNDNNNDYNDNNNNNNEDIYVKSTAYTVIIYHISCHVKSDSSKCMKHFSCKVSFGMYC